MSMLAATSGPGARHNLGLAGKDTAHLAPKLMINAPVVSLFVYSLL
jgi:hypothetical protein